MPSDERNNRGHIPDLREFAKSRFRESAPLVFAENARRAALELERLAKLESVADGATREALARVCAEFGRLAAEVDELRAEAAAYYASAHGGVAPESGGYGVRFPDEVDVPLGEFIDGSNWHAPEPDTGGRPRRWTGPGTRATINVFIDRQRPLELAFHIAGAAVPEILDGLRLLVDGEPTEFELANRRRGRAVIAPAPMRRGVEVAFDVPFTVSPMQRDPSLRDKRQLGIALSELTLRPLSSGTAASPGSGARTESGAAAGSGSG